MNFVGTSNIRDVIAFPKTQIGAGPHDPGAPGPVTDEQLKDVHAKALRPNA
jgi:aspartyl-tRNA synthetase